MILMRYKKYLSSFESYYSRIKPDINLANAENSASGYGLTKKIAKAITIKMVKVLKRL